VRLPLTQIDRVGKDGVITIEESTDLAWRMGSSSACVRPGLHFVVLVTDPSAWKPLLRTIRHPFSVMRSKIRE